jgi:endoglucanase
MKKFKNLLLFIVLAQITLHTMAQSLSYDIRLNQIGFLPNAIKRAAVVNTQSDSFKVMTSDLKNIVFQGQFLPSAYYTASGEDVFLADFTMLTEPGDYVLVISDLGKSVPFQVKSNVFMELTKATLKSFYFNRASTPILSEYGGIYAREEGHPDTSVVVLPSASSVNRPAGTIISTPGGWYDAGDYNKYVVSSGGTVFNLLSAYETYPGFFDTLKTNIPESNNNIPDILDEALWNIKWMMTMQDTDGGVYNKTTEANFSGFVMPSKVTATRYVAAKGTAATLDFAAVMAMTARIYKKYDPDLANTALTQAIKAWQWAKSNPNIVFKNPAASGIYPAVNTGEYSDSDFSDEFSWCASELYITTKDSNYYKEISFDQSFGVPGWPTVRTLGLLSLFVNKDSLTSIANIDLIKSKLIDAVSGTKNNLTTSPYRIPGDFYYWAGNNAFANWGMLFMQVFRLTGDASYFNAGVSTLDYLLGKNATTYCFVTGQGTKNPKHIHHRISSADGVAEPVPGLLVCGADPGDVSDCGTSKYPSTFPAKSYLDSECSYSTNEVAIGLNSPLVFLAGAIEAEYQKNFIDSMPRYFSISANKINLPYKIGNSVQVAFEGNTQWELASSVNWISISDTTGRGNATIRINCKTNNPDDSARTGKIYVYSQSTITDSIMVTQNGKRKSFRLEAEDYIGMSGIQTETTGDTDGSKNIGYVDANDWVTYSLDITDAGVYNVTIRHAGYAGNFDVSINDIFFQKVTFPKTADWQVWDSYTAEMTFSEGQHVLKFKFNSAGTNLNWYQFDWKYFTNIENIVIDNIKIYPNPADKFINIEFGPKQGTGEIMILTVEGKTILHQTSKSENFETIDVSGLEKGMYILKAIFVSGIYTKTFIIK